MTSAASEQGGRTTDIALDTARLSKRYRRPFTRGAGNRGLSDCNFGLPTGDTV